MAQAIALRPSRASRGFSLIELTVAVVLIGVLAAFSVPRLLQSVERSKAAESFKYLAAVSSALESYQATEGTFAADLAELDLNLEPPLYFNVGILSPGATGDLKDSWTLTLTRAGSNSGYGAYTVTFTEKGYDEDNSTIDSEVNPQSL